jgi:peptide/nickel transport system ATP-binding protein
MNNKLCSAQVVLSGRNIRRSFGFGRNRVWAVDGVNFNYRQGEVISLVGASGSGKTTLAKIILGLIKPTGGEIEFMGEPRRIKTFKQRKHYWSHIQAIFQDPFASFNQFHRVDRLFDDCIKMSKEPVSCAEAKEKKMEACGFVNLKYEELYNKYPFELSGGQMQRLMIARTFLIGPQILIADEPTSMIDACSRSTILDMLLKLREKNSMTIVFITHDLGLAYYVSDTISVMSHGKIVEEGDAEEIVRDPQDWYTRQLLNDVPKLREEWILTGDELPE